MAAYAGQKALKTTVLHCGRCRETVSVRQGDVIPPCPNGHTEFKKRMQDHGRTSRPRADEPSSRRSGS
jgi:uncharacterized CHY-type Zn-finger protein